MYPGVGLPRDSGPNPRARVILYLFDIDGTLLHANGVGRRAFDAVFAQQHGLDAASEGIRYGGKTDPAIIDEIFRLRLGRDGTDAEHAALLEAYVPQLNALLAVHGVQILNGVEEALDWLAPRARLGVATGNIRAGADAKLAAAELGHRFELGGYGCDSRIRSELVATAIRRGRASGPVEHVVVVGDTIYDIAAAKTCGATACAVATGNDPASALSDADAVLTSMVELPAWHAARFG